ncbi:Zn-dependent dipeptidase, dipeptidase homolog [Limimonas halophila]|uniref:Zn-dependent dipeptidase, dipeptidase homolog n=2 Tax=Limimonas halophila TaxID=1082479 RepID=A0A1G7SRK4_9PROT|nr:Zn-dependent dipeptidase, dipeptidase homolog [Limimonas halophila]
MRAMRRFGPLVVACGLLAGCADWIDEDMNAVYEPADAPAVTEETRELHSSLFVADLHADTMLWDRDLLERADFGHVDLPRLVEGNVALQVFAVVTKTPKKEEAPADAELVNPKASKCIAPDNLNEVGWLQVAQMRPLDTWFSLHDRAFYQIDRLKGFIDRSQKRHEANAKAPYLMLVRDVGDLQELIAKRQNGEPVVGALLAVEGAHWIGGDGMPVEKGVRELFDAGVRMVAPTHRFNNALGASSEGCDQRAGLTDDGRTFLEAAEGRGMVIDLAHATDRGISQGTADRSGPVVVSHTGVRSRCDQAQHAGDCVYERNLRRDEIQDVARTGGVVAIGYWPQAAGRGMESVAATFHAAYKALSAPDFVDEMRRQEPDYDPLDHIALGSDFDGAVKTPFDVAGLQTLTAALRQFPTPEGVPAFDDEALRRIYGRNVCKILAAQLPADGSDTPENTCSNL